MRVNAQTVLCMAGALSRPAQFGAGIKSLSLGPLFAVCRHLSRGLLGSLADASRHHHRVCDRSADPADARMQLLDDAANRWEAVVRGGETFVSPLLPAGIMWTSFMHGRVTPRSSRCGVGCTTAYRSETRGRCECLSWSDGDDLSALYG